jgi:starch phosphorylase
MSVAGETGAIQTKILSSPPLAMDVDAIVRDFTHYFRHTLGRRVLSTDSPFVYRALVLTLRDRLVERINQTTREVEAEDSRQTCYLSLEFLMGRLLRNTVLNLGLEDVCEQVFQRLGLSYADVLESEHDTGLGNGGLGRLAACFLDSCATLRLPVIGYGIRYRYGMFRQHIEEGRQVEEPDNWLQDDGFPWEIGRFELTQRVKFGGRAEPYIDSTGAPRYRWVDTHDVLAVPFDVPIPGYRNGCVNTLRLWRAKATYAFDLGEFNAGSYADSVAAKTEAENITMVLYPNASNENGQELRLRQQYFLASASLMDCIHHWLERHGNSFKGFEDKNCFQLNDTHPAIAVAELMRLLLDDYGLKWERAWDITRSTMAYTNHTLLPEALETWPVSMFERLLPRLLQIILEINAQFLDEVARRFPDEHWKHSAMSLIEEGPQPRIRMAHLAIVGSFSVNGVAELHSRLLREGLFKNFSELWPQKFNSKTNGVTPRRWLAGCNPALSSLITEVVGDGWATDLERLSGIAAFAEDEEFQTRWRRIKYGNKQRLSRFIERRAGVVVDPHMLFDIQVKRIHEYKRQALNVLHAVHLYRRIKQGDTNDFVPRAIVIGGKAAPGYLMAKDIIKFANNVAAVINSDAAAKDLLRCVFVPDYNVSAMEVICPAADLSAQISTAGKEASGTGNMKFMMNGAVTIGTLDGANVEIREAVGHENFFLFGLSVEEIDALRGHYDPEALIAASDELSGVFEMIDSGVFNRNEPSIFDGVVGAMRHSSDPWFSVADAVSFFAAQRDAAAQYADTDTWTRKSILNTAASGRFSSDRTIQAYNDEIWRLQPLVL